MPGNGLCYICGKDATKSGPHALGPDHAHPSYRVNCERCGKYEIDIGLASTILEERLAYVLSGITKRSDGRIVLNRENIKSLIDGAIYPHDLIEYIDAFVFLLHEKADSMDKGVSFRKLRDYPLIFCKSPEEFYSVAKKASEIGYVEMRAENVGGEFWARLDIKGWERLVELRRKGPVNGNEAFMAMPFGDRILDSVFLEHWRTAIHYTGFDLKRVSDLQTAGLIDDQIRVRIRNAKFLLAELTGNNNGVYWEAGYAEGLGKPVIYLQRKDEGEEIKSHFDTNHHVTIFWNMGSLDQAKEQLKSTIRATFPAEARMSDAY